MAQERWHAKSFMPQENVTPPSPDRSGRSRMSSGMWIGALRSPPTWSGPWHDTIHQKLPERSEVLIIKNLGKRELGFGIRHTRCQ